MRTVKLTKNSDSDKYKCFGYGTRFDAHRFFSLSDGSGFGKNVIIFGADMSLLVHIDNKKSYFDCWESSNRWFRWYYVDCGEGIFYNFCWETEDSLFKLAS